jgi:hypothetical protein
MASPEYARCRHRVDIRRGRSAPLAGTCPLPGARVVHHQVGVRPGGDRPLARVEPGQPGGGGAGHVDPRGRRDPPVDHPLVEQVHPVLDRADPVGDAGEVVRPASFCSQRERAVVGRHHVDPAGGDPPTGVSWWPSWRQRSGGEHTSGRRRARAGTSSTPTTGTAGRSRRTPAGPRSRPRHRLVERVGRRDVDDDQRASGHLGERHHPVHGLGLERRRRGEQVVDRGSVSPRSTASARSTSMAMPFSACIMTITPRSAARRIARRMRPSSSSSCPGRP